MVGKILLSQIRRRVQCGDDMVRDLLRAFGQVKTRFISFILLPVFGLGLIGIDVKGIFRKLGVLSWNRIDISSAQHAIKRE